MRAVRGISRHVAPSINFRVQLAPDERAPAGARHAVRDALAGDEPGWRETAALIVSELVTNALRHGAPHPTDQIVLLVERSPESLRVEVRDPGRGSTRPRRRRPQGPAGGWGLMLVERLADRWGYTEEGGATLVWADIDAPA